MTTNPSDVSARLRPKWDRDVPFMRAAIKLRDHGERDAAAALNAAIVEANAKRTEAADLIDSQSRLLAEREWRVIDETTPMDGRGIMLLLTFPRPSGPPGYGRVIAYWRPKNWRIDPSGWISVETGEPVKDAECATHWQPLPSPPKLSEPT